MKSIRLTSLALIITLASSSAWSFCGFYVAKADASLFNTTSQVILARKDNTSTITMSSDFEGDVKDFAMVVPVPVILQREDIRTVTAALFEKLDAYSAPRLAEYYDENPCYKRDYMVMRGGGNDKMVMFSQSAMAEEAEDLGVTIEATYDVDEYEVLILSATESSGLETWLNKNGYKIPKGAQEVLQPYIKSGMKFFVVKVNLDRLEAKGSTKLNPLQISFQSPKFMLPIRLGMANANGDQDMIVYALTDEGRIETTNYRTTKIPTNEEIPLPVQHQFGKFYKSLFDREYKKEFGKTVFLEYAWNISGNAGVKCDPCVGAPPIYADLKEAGATWLTSNNGDQWNPNYGKCFFTRLHVRYNRENFPQDLQFQVTPNTENFQGRYVIRHPASGDLSCDDAQGYLKEVRQRREREVINLAHLTGWERKDYDLYVSEFDKLIESDKNNKKKNSIFPIGNGPDSPKGPFGESISWKTLFISLITALLGIIGWSSWQRKKQTA